ncbi:hypothetical protein [Roseovarius sp.]|uniref:hypothetical protein n=1 Tax=Roseovarius sp. TaxID=1486281 RepID=UPI003A981475
MMIALSALGCLGVLALTGIWPIRKSIDIFEGKRGMQAAAPSLLRRIRGWSFVGVWGLLVLYVGAFYGDWAKTGDMEGAASRAMERSRFVIELVMMIMASDQ